LGNEDAICDAEVYCDGDDHGHETCQETTSEVGDVTDKPDEDEKERDGFSVAIAVVFN
jgi:hypothetical protein